MDFPVSLGPSDRICQLYGTATALAETLISYFKLCATRH
jgi:hypothetical protein